MRTALRIALFIPSILAFFVGAVLSSPFHANNLSKHYADVILEKGRTRKAKEQAEGDSVRQGGIQHEG